MTQRKSVAITAVEVVENVSHYLRVPRFHSIRSRILALAVVGTMIPAAISLGVAYTQNRKAREEKLTQELVSESSQTARAMSVWLKERLYDLRVFATSEEVSNNINRTPSRAVPAPAKVASAPPRKATATAKSSASSKGSRASAKTPAAAPSRPAPKTTVVNGRLREYLRSLHERFTDFDQLFVVDDQGHVLASSSPLEVPPPVQLPADWQKALRQQNQLVGQPYWDSAARKGKLIMAVPVQRPDGRLLGAFAAELTLHPVQTQLKAFVPDTNSTVYLATADGALIASSRGVSSALLRSRLKPGSLEKLKEHETATAIYDGPTGRKVVGTIKGVPQTAWAVIAERPADAAFLQVRQFRNVALLVVVALLLLVASSAYYLGIIIVRPLERLAKGAAEVSLGDLDVDLPNTGGGEVAVLTGVFNRMVKRLREGRQELERLSVTDGLTGLTNHRALMQRLHEETLRSTRSKHAFCVIMADVDHFKAYNDDFGHPAGDVVLKRVAEILKDATRTVDCAARYGGEEFALLLPETEMDGALEVAERIRSRVESEPFAERSVTVSVGVAEFPTDADRAEKIIAVADSALYQAKHGGRNRVARASGKSSGRKAADQESLPAALRPAKARRNG